MKTPIQRMLDASARYTDARFGLGWAKNMKNAEQEVAAQDALREAEADFEIALTDYLNQRGNEYEHDE